MSIDLYKNSLYSLTWAMHTTFDYDPRIKTDDAIKVFGNKARLAAALGVTRAAVQRWEESGYLPSINAYRALRRYPRKFKKLEVRQKKAAGKSGD